MNYFIPELLRRKKKRFVKEYRGQATVLFWGRKLSQVVSESSRTKEPFRYVIQATAVYRMHFIC